jgi:hypothetical protein
VDIARLSLTYTTALHMSDWKQDKKRRRGARSPQNHSIVPAVHPLWPLAERTRHDIVSGTTEARRRRATHARDTPPQ